MYAIARRDAVRRAVFLRSRSGFDTSAFAGSSRCVLRYLRTSESGLSAGGGGPTRGIACGGADDGAGDAGAVGAEEFPEFVLDVFGQWWRAFACGVLEFEEFEGRAAGPGAALDGVYSRVWVGAGLEEAAGDAGAAVGDGEVKGRPTGVVGRADLGAAWISASTTSGRSM